MHRVMAKVLSCFHIIEAMAPWPIAAHIHRMALPGLTPGMPRAMDRLGFGAKPQGLSMGEYL